MASGAGARGHPTPQDGIREQLQPLHPRTTESPGSAGTAAPAGEKGPGVGGSRQDNPSETEFPSLLAQMTEACANQLRGFVVPPLQLISVWNYTQDCRSGLDNGYFLCLMPDC